MRWLWLASNLAIIGLAAVFGYFSITPDRVQHSNPDIVFCSVVLIATTCVGFYWMRRLIRNSDYLIRPSLFRSFFERDRLQSACAGALIWLACAIGASFRVPGGGPKTFWYVAFIWSMAIGLVLGEAIGIIIHRDQIDAI